MKPLIVLTATVTPWCARLSVKDVALRRSEYRGAIADILSATSHDLMVMENSGANASDLGISGSRRVTLVNVSPTDTDQKGKAEAHLLDAAGEFLSQGPWTHLVKLTGRLRVKDISSRVAELCGGDLGVYIKSNLHTADSRLFAAERDVLAQYITGMAPEVNEEAGVYLEHVLCRRSLRAISDGYRLPAALKIPRYRGRSGSTGASYGSSTERLKILAQTGLRWVMHDSRVVP